MTAAQKKLSEIELSNYFTWIKAVWINSRGQPLRFDNRKYLVQIYQDQHHSIVYTKSAQMGLSERVISEAVWLAEQKGFNSMFVTPAQSQLQDFVQARLNPVLEMSDYLKDRIDSDDTKTQKLGLKKIGKGHIYFRGSQNSKQIISVDADCFDDKTEILTNSGWKLFKDLSKTETVATINSRGFLEYQKPTRYIKYRWKGDLLSIENEQVNFAVKPKHNLYLKKQRKDFALHKAEDVYGLTYLEFKRDANWKGKRRRLWEIPEVTKEWFAGRPQYKKSKQQHYIKKYPKQKVELKSFLEFLGLYIAEGCVSKQHSSWYNTVRIGQNKGRVFDRILFLLDSLGWEYKIYPSYQKGCKCYEIRLYNVQLATHLSDICGVGSRNKKIHKKILSLNRQLLRHLFDGLMAGDGGGGYYSTASKQLADDFEELLLKIGYAGRRKIKEAKKFMSLNGHEYNGSKLYIISINRKKLTPKIKKRDWKKIPYNGDVYCVSVPNKTVYIRRGETSIWAGNCIFLDERDRFVEENIPFIEKRLLASALKWRRDVSTPTLPNYGIHKTYLESDQRVWQVKCPRCGWWQELDFFKHVDFIKKVVRCEECRRKLDRYSDGRWHVSNPSSSVHGYKISGMYNPTVTIPDMIKKYREAKRSGFASMQQFFNQDLGLPYEVEGQRIKLSELVSCKQEYSFPPRDVKRTYAGVDVGDRLHNVVVLTKLPDDSYRLVWAGTVTKFLGPHSSIEQVIKQFDVKCLVIDKKPETAKVRELIAKFPGIVYAATYPTMAFTVQKYYLWDEVNYEVKLDRTISLDYLVSDIQNKKLQLPSNIEMVKGFFTQLQASQRIIDKSRNGKEIPRWIEKGADHYMHTLNYARIAQLKGTVGEALLDYYAKPQEGITPGFVDWIRVNARELKI